MSLLGSHDHRSEMQTRAELYQTLGLGAYEKLDASIVESVTPAAPGAGVHT